MVNSLVSCPGCGSPGSNTSIPPDGRFRNNPACWQAYAELSGHTVVAVTGGFFHQTAVDTYQAQHCPPGKTRMLAFGLLGLHLVLDQGCTGAQVQQVHMVLAREQHPLPEIAPLPAVGAGSAAEVLERVPIVGAKAAVQEWAGQVWRAFERLHDIIRGWASGWPDSARAAAHR